MSTTIDDGGLTTQDVDESRVYTFDWTDNLGSTPEIVTSAWVLTPLDATGGASSELLKDNEAVVTGNKKTTVRLRAGIAGTKYQVVNRITTDETPAQMKEKRFFLRITS